MVPDSPNPHLLRSISDCIYRTYQIDGEVFTSTAAGCTLTVYGRTYELSPPPHPAKFSLFSHNFTSMMNPFNLQLGIALTIVIGVIWGLGWGLSSLLEELKSSSHRRGQGR